MTDEELDEARVSEALRLHLMQNRPLPGIALIAAPKEQGGWTERTIDIGSTSGPEPSIRHIVLHYYTSHDVPLEKALVWTDQYLAALRTSGEQG